MFWLGLVVGFILGVIATVFYVRWFFGYAISHEHELVDMVSTECRKFLDITKKTCIKEMEDNMGSQSNPFTYNA